MFALEAAAFLVSAEARVIAPLLPAISNDLKVTIGQAGLLISAYAVPYGLFQLVYGPIADRYSRQKVMGFALGLFSLGTLVSGFMPDLASLSLVRFATGAAAAGTIPVALAYIGDAVPYERRQAALGKLVAAASLGGVLSAALGGIIATLVSWRWLFWIYGTVSVAASVLLLRMPAASNLHAQPARWFDPYADIFTKARARAVALYALVLFEGFALLSTQGFLGAYLYEKYHLSYALIGLLLMLGAVASTITARFVGRLVARIGEAWMLRTGGVLLALMYVLVLVEPYWIFFPLAMLVGGTGFIVAHSTLQARATELLPARRGTAVALFAFSLFVGGGFGTWVAGVGIERFGYTASMLATAAVVLVFAGIAPRLALRKG